MLKGKKASGFVKPKQRWKPIASRDCANHLLKTNRKPIASLAVHTTSVPDPPDLMLKFQKYCTQDSQSQHGYIKLSENMLCDVNFVWLGPTLTNLKVLTNDKRCWLKVVSFDMSSLKLFTLRFSNKSVRAPSCDVWIHHVANKFPRFSHTPPPLYRYWESTTAFK